ncbi:uncharacterized protein CHSO_4350 [Chryseobacterium sp. StRB126]|uniref:hypothetical protein n=1 Tax=Chryseobacterium sp. StRB126 TaxID=878220 RepID=UPI0004E98341|nr:hypothetical protein [Chryseobacterium sp. StRB126]BAP33387.1 uncharacterized protein CHSO_4350 [Chryseobacterium sp. StRB126]
MKNFRKPLKQKTKAPTHELNTEITMNFIKKHLSTSKKKINIILTLQISESDLDSSEYVNFKIVNCFDMPEKYEYHSSKEYQFKKLEYISDEIMNSEHSILICNTGLSITDFDTLTEMLKSYELIIDRILVPNQSKRNKKLADGQEAYRNHSRWLHFYPGEIEDIYNEFEAKIKSLKAKYENTETKILEI